MSLTRLERSEKNLKKRLIKSPMASSAAETILLLTKKHEFELTNAYTSRRTDSDLFQKSLKRTQSVEFMKILTEKNQEIKKLQEEKNALASQLNELSGTVKKYYKIRTVLREKDLVIESLRANRDAEEVKSRKGSRKSVKKGLKNSRKRLRIHSGLLIDSECGNECLSVRPSSAANCVSKQTPRVRLGSEVKFAEFSEDMKNLLTKTEKILKCWKKSYKAKNNQITLKK